jgi:hypothetical protein
VTARDLRAWKDSIPMSTLFSLSNASEQRKKIGFDSRFSAAPTEAIAPESEPPCCNAHDRLFCHCWNSWRAPPTGLGPSTPSILPVASFDNAVPVYTAQ